MCAQHVAQIRCMIVLLIKNQTPPWPGGSVVGASSLTPKGCGFDPRSGHEWEATEQCFLT